jgi:hypothetical protein
MSELGEDEILAMKREVEAEINGAGIFSNISSTGQVKSLSVRRLLAEIANRHINSSQLNMAIKRAKMGQKIAGARASTGPLVIYDAQIAQEITIEWAQTDLFGRDTVIYNGGHLYTYYDLKYLVWYFFNNYSSSVGGLRKFMKVNKIRGNYLDLGYILGGVKMHRRIALYDLGVSGFIDLS